MPDKLDKAKRKQILNDLRLKEQEQFERSLPMKRAAFNDLFDYLDEHLQEHNCEDDHTLTVSYLNLIGTNNIDEVISWLKDKGGYCDCEVISNIEDHFE